jgi:hypothetical protein
MNVLAFPGESFGLLNSSARSDYSVVTTTTTRTEKPVDQIDHHRDAIRLKHLRCGPELWLNRHRDGLRLLSQ